MLVSLSTIARVPAVGAAVTLGNHAQTVQIDTLGTSPAVVGINSVSGGAVILLRGGAFADNATPTDNKGNTLTQRGTDQGYAGGLWPGFGLQIWAATNVVGGTSHQISTVKSHTDWEISVVMWETFGGATITTAQGSAAGAGAGVAYNSPSITLPGAGMVFAIASGDGNAATPDQTMTPSAGWTMMESSFLPATAYVPFAVASRYYSAGGTYQMQWTPAVDQGSSLFMVGVTA